MRKTLYIGSLASHEDARAVQSLLSRVGAVLYFKMMLHDDFIRRHGGYAIVEMENEEDAIRAIRTLHGTRFQGKSLEVREATAMEETAAGHPRMFDAMNMNDDIVSPERD